MANSIKFGSSDIINFIEIYRSHECLWNTSNANYKNRDSRNSALSSFANELNINGFGVKEITSKIKNLRSQYLQEKKKIRASMGTGSSAEDIYHRKLQWFNLLDSFLMTSAEPRATTSNLNGGTQASEISYDFTDDGNENVTEDLVEAVPRNLGSKYKSKCIVDDSVKAALNKLDVIAEKASVKEDELDKFSHYVAASLRKLKTISCIKAQDEIQAVLSKYRLLDVSAETTPSSSSLCTPMPQSPYTNAYERME